MYHNIQQDIFIQLRYANLPGSDNGPTAGKYCRRIYNKTDAESFRIVTTEQPYQILNHLIVHAVHTEVGEVEYDTQIVYDFFETFFTSLFL